MILAAEFLARANSPFAAYAALQIALMRHYIARGGTEEAWCRLLAPAFRRRYAWVLETRPDAERPRRRATRAA